MTVPMTTTSMTTEILLNVDMLGDFTLRSEEKSVSYPPNPKNGGLLAYLILNPTRDHARSKLADMFWPDTNDPRGNLRRALSTLREDFASLGANPDKILITTRDSIKLNADSLSTDIDRFKQLLKAADPAQPSEQILLLAQATELYRGELLAAFSETWIVGKRNELHSSAVRAFDRLITLYEESADPTEAAQVAARWIEIDPDQEAAYLRLIQLYHADSDLKSAQETFRLLEHRLSRMNTVPSETALQMMDALTRNGSGTHPAPMSILPATLESSASNPLPINFSVVSNVVQTGSGEQDLRSPESKPPLTAHAPSHPRTSIRSRVLFLAVPVFLVLLAGFIIAKNHRMNHLGTTKTPVASKATAIHSSAPPCLAYESEREGKRHIILMRTDRTEMQLTSGDSFNACPQVSPDGKTIVFHGERDGNQGLWLMNADGSNIRFLTKGYHDTAPTWSPDGCQVAFERVGEKHEEIWIINVDGTNSHKISNDKFAAATCPAWSHDGTRIAFSGYLNNSSHCGLYIMERNGSHLLCLSDASTYSLNPMWSRNDLYITFEIRSSVGWDIYKLPANGSSKQPEPLTCGRKVIGHMSLSSDEQIIAFADQRDGSPKLYLLDLHTHNIKPLTSRFGLDVNPDLFPSNATQP